MIILGLDPGTTHTGCVWFDGTRVVRAAYVENKSALLFCGRFVIPEDFSAVACEMLQCFGMAVGAETFETAYWIGRFMCACSVDWHRVYRKEVKEHLCGTHRAKDPNVRQALLDRFGGKAAVGTKKAPGPLYGVSGHCWSALAVAVTAWDRHYARGRIA